MIQTLSNVRQTCTRRSKRTDKMATWILEIIQLNKTIEANSNITTCLSLSPLPSSFLDLVKQRKLEQIRQELPSRSSRHKGKRCCLSQIRAQERAVSETLNSLIVSGLKNSTETQFPTKSSSIPLQNETNLLGQNDNKSSLKPRAANNLLTYVNQVFFFLLLIVSRSPAAKR